ncbi:DUF6042 family protein [Streptomyces sp. WAC 06725]|uniref:DUF6042 family protein n=1 Tax=Streptomyces sp. WAC 06725 TaxID=2203209 RepID=UPI001C8B4447|nr:DUF6042 family protein [Streptomyces sp. WAC 06725]
MSISPESSHRFVPRLPTRAHPSRSRSLRAGGRTPRRDHTSLDRLADVINGSSHGARQALQMLSYIGGFSASDNIAALAPHQAFQLRCDWAVFDAERLSIHGMDDEGRIVAPLPAGS